MSRFGVGFDAAADVALEIQAGEGGEDSRLFVYELFSAYLKYAESLGLKCELLDNSSGNLKARVRGPNAGRHFLNEPGKHVCQRVPETESQGRRHTSTVSVSVLPFDVQSKIELADSDVEIEPFNAGGPGGQKRNKTLSDVRLIHKPTGIQAVGTGRKYHQNLAAARKVLTERVNEAARAGNQAARSAARCSQMGGGTRGDKIRTYNFIQSRVVDHRLGTKTGNIKGVMKGQFNLVLR